MSHRWAALLSKVAKKAIEVINTNLRASAKAIMEKIERKNKIVGLSFRRHRHFLDSDW